VAAALIYSGVMSFVLLKAIGLVIPLRAETHEETEGLDLTQHGEEAYIHGEGNASMAPGHAAASSAAPQLRTQPVQ